MKEETKPKANIQRLEEISEEIEMFLVIINKDCGTEIKHLVNEATNLSPQYGKTLETALNNWVGSQETMNLVAKCIPKLHSQNSQ